MPLTNYKPLLDEGAFLFGVEFVIWDVNKRGMTISDIQLYQLLKNKLGENEAEQLVSFVKGEVKTEFDIKRQSLATKDDITHIKDDITHIREDMNHIREDMLNIKSDLSKSIYVVGLVQFIAIVGSVMTIFNFMLK